MQGIRFALFILFLCATLKCCCLFAQSPPSPVIVILVCNVHFHECVHLPRCPLHKGLRSFMITELSSTPEPSQSSKQCTIRGAAKGVACQFVTLPEIAVQGARKEMRRTQDQDCLDACVQKSASGCCADD